MSFLAFCIAHLRPLTSHFDSDISFCSASFFLSRTMVSVLRGYPTKPAFVCPLGRDVGIRMMADALESQFIQMIHKGPNLIYSSMDLEADDINNNLLLQWKHTLKQLILQDPRGGYQKQDELVEAMQMLVHHFESELLAAWATDLSTSVDWVISIFCHKIRVMLAHIRAKMRNGCLRSDGFGMIADVIECHAYASRKRGHPMAENVAADGQQMHEKKKRRKSEDDADEEEESATDGQTT